jgi:hypothetical protein
MNGKFATAAAAACNAGSGNFVFQWVLRLIEMRLKDTFDLFYAWASTGN